MEIELIQETGIEADYRAALELLAQVAGRPMADRVERARSSLSRGLWAMSERGGRLLAEVNSDSGTVLVHAVPTLNSIRLARVLTTRVRCHCGMPRNLQGLPRSGDSYRCSQCDQTVFVQVD